MSARPELAAAMGKQIRIVETAMRLKAVMIKRKLRSAKAKCPFCKNGEVLGVLTGKRNHIRMACTVCPVQIIE